MKNKPFCRITAFCAWVIISVQCLAQSTYPAEQLPPVIRRYADYRRTVQADSLQQMVPLEQYIRPLITDFTYATKANFTHTILYRHPVALLRLPAAKALAAVQEALNQQGLSLKIYDAYRPYAVTCAMWAIVPDERYAANPAKGSGHNRGAAVDVSLVSLATGLELEMPTPFDDFTEKAHHNYQQLPPAAIQHRALLREVMEAHGFIALETEWWHYALPGAAERFSLLDLDFSQLAGKKKAR